MARTAADYPVTFGYGAQDGIYYGITGRIGRYHRGNDRPTPAGTPIVIGTHTIGWTGASGVASGNHLHTQAMIPGTNTDSNPSPFEFKYGTVVNAGVHKEWGNFVTIRTNNIDLTYAHLSRINVSVGQYIGAPAPAPAPPKPQGDEMIASRDEAIRIYQMLRPNGNPSEAEIKGTAGKRSYKEFVLSGQKEVQARNASLNSMRVQLSKQEALINQQNKIIQTLKADDTSDKQKITAGLEAIKKLNEQLATTEAKISELRSLVEKPEIEPEQPAEPTKPDEPKVEKPSLLTKLILAILKTKK